MGMRGDWTGEMGRISAIILLAAGVFLGVLPAEAAVWHVNAASTAANPDGQSWDTAYPSIQPAVDAAASGDEVWVAKGTYTGTGDQVVNLKAGVTLYGGFVGTETSRGQRDWNANATVIDGQKARRCLKAADVTSAIDGFTLQNGWASGGGGMCDGTAPNCLFSGNVAYVGGGGMCDGTATNCTFSANRATHYGGAMDSCIATGCSVTHNEGGGMCDGRADRCTFTENKGRGMLYGTATNCTFIENSSNDGGGLDYGTATNCSFFGNTAHHGGGLNGGIAENCAFTGNAADYGGGIYGDRGYGDSYGSISTNCTFTKNVASFGGGAYNCAATNCTFTENSAGGYGDGIYHGKLTNCILWKNLPKEVSGQAKVVFSCLSMPVQGLGNIVGDPLFVNAEAGDFRLQLGSPCIDTAKADSAPVTDIVGVPRPQGVGVDMGAYEWLVTVSVPDVLGQTRGAAVTILTGAGLAVGTVTQEYSSTVPAGTVISQMPAVGTEVVPGTPVNLVVSRGVAPSVMPIVVGQPRAQAETSITDAGLVLGLVMQDYSETVPEGTVISQSPAVGTELPPGTVVSIVLSLGPLPVVEGEGEAVNVDTVREQLASAFSTADANGDRALSFEEAVAAVPGLTQELFNELDTNGDGQLSEAELGVDSGEGCPGCQGGKGDFGIDGWGRGLRELFVLGLGLTGLLAIGGRRT